MHFAVVLILLDANLKNDVHASYKRCGVQFCKYFNSHWNHERIGVDVLFVLLCQGILMREKCLVS